MIEYANEAKKHMAVIDEEIIQPDLLSTDFVHAYKDKKTKAK